MKPIVVVVLLGMSGDALAQIPPSPTMAPPPTAQPLAAPSSATTSRGPGLLSGGAGSSQSIMIPGSPVPGTLFNNGNGSSTLMVPGSVPQVIITPR